MKDVSVQRIIGILNTALDDLKLAEDNCDVDFSALDIDSIAFITIVVALEEEFDCEIPDEKLLISEMNTVNKIYKVLKEIESKGD